MPGYRLVDEAQRELESGVSFYSATDPVLGEQFALEVRRVCHQIAESPLHGAELRSGVRRRLVRRFPYSILYSVEASGVLILAIAHQNRKPGYWTSRT